MIDFDAGSIFKLSHINPAEIQPQIAGLLLEEETLLVAAKTVRDFVVFTDKRILAVNVQGMTGRKRDFTTLPYSRIQAFSVETAGTFDMDAELELWFSGLGKVRFEFRGSFDVTYLGRLIATKIL
jgi:hypothetical protein